MEKTNNNFYENIIRLLKDDNYKNNNKLFEILYNTLKSKNVDKEKIYKKLDENRIEIGKLLTTKIEEIEIISNKFDDKSPLLFNKQTTYNKFKTKYNEIYNENKNYLENISTLLSNNQLTVDNYNNYISYIDILYDNINEKESDNLVSYYNKLYNNQLSKKNGNLHTLIINKF